MTELFRRSGKVIIDNIELVIDPNDPGSALDVAFEVTRSLKPEPNTAEVQVFNMAPQKRNKLEELDKVTVSIEAGYLNNTSLVFLGVARTVFTNRQGPDLVTHVQAGDGEKEFRQGHIDISFKPGVSNAQVLDALVAAVGLGRGNMDSDVLQIFLAATEPIFPQGAVLSGQASKVLHFILKSMELDYSIQNGAMQFLEFGAPVAAAAVLLSPETGLVGTPSVDNKGIVSAQALITPDIYPGRIVEINSEFLTGQFRIETCRYSGETSGNNWYVDLEGQKQ